MILDKYLNAFKNKKKILEGIKNKIFKYEHVEAEAAIRMATCKACPSIDNEGSHCVVPYTNPCCKECGCSLSLKVRSLSSECPLGHWKALMDESTELKLIKQLDNNDTN